MAKKKWKKTLKKVGKAAAIAGALYGASKLGKRGLKGNVEKTAAMEDANIGINTRPQRVYENFAPKKVVEDFDPHFYAGVKEGGRISKKGGGIAKRGMGAAFKKGGHVKSMGIAKRGGGAAKR